VYVEGAIGDSYKGKMVVSRPANSALANINVMVDHIEKADSGQLVPLAHQNHYFYGNPGPKFSLANIFDESKWKEGKEYQTDQLNADGTMTVIRVSQSWHQRAAVLWVSSNPDDPNAPPQDPRITDTTTTLVDTNQVSKLAFFYDDTVPYNNKKDIYEYDYATGAPPAFATRHTHIDYVTTYNGANYAGDTSIHLRSLPLRQVINSVNPSTGAETWAAQTEYEYDCYNASITRHAMLVDRGDISGLDSLFAWSYTPRGNVTKVDRWLNSTGSTFVRSWQQYDIAGNMVKTFDPNGNPTTYDFNDNFGPPDGVTAYSDNDIPPELHNVFQKSYAFPCQVINALSQYSLIQYDYYLGRPVDVQDPNMVITSTYFSDVLDRPTKVVRAANQATTIRNQTTFAYNDTSRLITTTSDKDSYNDNLLKNELVYDGLGRTCETHQYEGASYITASKQTFDAIGRIALSYNPYRLTSDATYGWRKNTYDALSRVIKVEHCDNTRGCDTPTNNNGVVQTDYSGNQVLVTDQAAKKRISQANALGQLVNVWEVTPSDQWTVGVTFAGTSYNGYQTVYQYDALNNLCTVTQGGQTRSFLYDPLSRLTSATNPESGLVSYEYYDNGTLKCKTDARTIKTTFTYDTLNRPTSKSYSTTSPDPTVIAAVNASPAVNYYYDGQNPPFTPAGFSRGSSTGRLVAVTINSTALGNFYGYDVLGRSNQFYQRVDGTDYGTTGLTYDRASALKTASYPSGKVYSLSYDSAERISSVSFNGAYYLNPINYAPQGAVSSETLGNGLSHQMGYNSRLQPMNISLGSLLTLAYDYGSSNNNGNVQSLTITPGSGQTPFVQNFLYDPLNRLQCASETVSGAQQWKQTFGYDRSGNRWFDVANTTASLLGPLTSQTDVSATSNRIAKSGYSYDAAGNLCWEPGKSYTYDAENRLVTATNGTSSSYVYDGEGRRVKKTVGVVTTRLVYDQGGQLIGEYDGSGSLIKEYVYGGAGLIATCEPSNGVRYATGDHLGTPRVWTKSDGSVADYGRHDYAPFGEELFAGLGGRTGGTSGQKYATVTQADGQRKQFDGYERDNESGLDFAQARYYASVQGRFTSVDPLMASASVYEPQSWNRYTYVQNNPCKFIDPTGMKEISAEDCQKDGRCVTVKVNVIYDAKTNKGKGLTDKQKAKFEKEQLQKAKDEYGEAKIRLDVSYTAGELKNNQITGISEGAVNVFVTDSIFGKNSEAASGVSNNGIAVTIVNITAASEGTLGHEFAHHFLGHTTSSIGRAMSEYGGLPGDIAYNVYAEIPVFHARTSLAIVGPYYGQTGRDLLPGEPLRMTTPFNSGARAFQQFLNSQKANRPRQ